jgi:hypothetical protein
MGRWRDEVEMGVSDSTHLAGELCSDSKRIPKDFLSDGRKGGKPNNFIYYGFYID